MTHLAAVRPVRVLCVDDNRDAADSLADLLTLVGCEARACYDAATALLEVRFFAPDVCFIDLNMPGMDGDELAVRLRSRSAASRSVLVAVTAAGDDGSRARVRSAGFDKHLLKPADPSELIAVVHQARM